MCNFNSGYPFGLAGEEQTRATNVSGSVASNMISTREYLSTVRRSANKVVCISCEKSNEARNTGG